MPPSPILRDGSHSGTRATNAPWFLKPRCVVRSCPPGVQPVDPRQRVPGYEPPKFGPTRRSAQSHRGPATGRLTGGLSGGYRRAVCRGRRLDGSLEVRCPDQAAGTGFVGRYGERERLAGVLRGDPGSAAAAMVTGDAGIGKSRLLAEIDGAVPDVAVLVGSCLPLSESLPYGAITDAFDPLTGPAGGPVLDRALRRCAPFVAPQIAALIPAMSPEAHPRRMRRRTGSACSRPSATSSQPSARPDLPRSLSRTCTGPMQEPWTC